MAHNIAHPVLDSYFLPEPPFEVFSKGEQQAIPLLVGSNADEARSLTDVSDITVENYAAAVTDRWGSLPQALIDAYSYETDKEAKQARLNFERDLRFGWDIWAWARLHSRTGSPDVYYYYFAHEPPFLPGSPYEGWGASHFAELWYVLGRVEEEPWGERAADTELSNDVMTYWTNFARTGNPNGSGLPNWPRYGEAQSVMYLKVPLHTGATPNTDKLRIFESVYSGFRGER
jgi:para-nitrobenzyl esterase